MESLVAGARLNLHLDALPEDVFEPEFVAEAPALGFEAFLPDARLFGRVRLEATRLTDLLNAHPSLLLHAATIERLLDGTTRWAAEVAVARSQLVAVLATGPRGDPALRRWTQTHPVAVQSGDFLMGGLAHATPSLDPLASILERPPMVPLTNAWIEYWPGGRRLRQWIGTIIFNREVTDWVRIVTEEELEYGRLRPTGASAPLA